jgi:hypothetical protein
LQWLESTRLLVMRQVLLPESRSMGFGKQFAQGFVFGKSPFLGGQKKEVRP